MSEFETSYATSSDNTNIAYLSIGRGKDLVIVHGSFTVADEWFATARSLSDRYRVHVVERRGRGRSGDAENHSLDLEVDDLAAVISAIGGTPILLGHSFGGAVAIRYVLSRRATQSLIIYEPAASMHGPISDGKAPKIKSLLDSGNVEEALVTAHRCWTRTPEHEIDAFKTHPVWEQHKLLMPTLVREVMALDGFAPSADDLQSLGASTTFLLGTHTQKLARDYAGAFVARTPGMTLLPIMGQGHICYLLDPDLMAERIESAIAACDLIRN